MSYKYSFSSTLCILSTLCIFLFSSCKNDTSPVVSDSGKQEIINAQGKVTIYNVNSDESKIYWIGSKPTGQHSGHILISNASINVSNNKVVSGSFNLDMNSITVTDLKGGKKEGLESHLKGLEADSKDDFFNVQQFPTAKFEATKIIEIKNNAKSNSLIYGNLTLKGITKEIGFKAHASFNGNQLKITSEEFSINRTDWGIKFKSKNFVEGLKDKFIDDEIKISLSLIASK